MTEPTYEDREKRLQKVYAAVHVDSLLSRTNAVLKVMDAEQAEMLARIVGGTDAELSRRLEWATGRNGATLLAQIRAEGLDVMTVTKEDEE